MSYRKLKSEYQKNTLPKIRQCNILGFRVEDWIMPELIAHLEQAIRLRIPTNVWGISIPVISMFRKYPEAIEYSNKFDVVVPDGAGIPIITHFFNQRLRTHLGLPHVAQTMIDMAALNGYRLMILGGTPDVNNSANENLRCKYPNLNICPGLHGYYHENEEFSIAQKIKDAHPDILLVGMSMPKKERFLLQWTNFMQVPVCIACGGYIDILAGKTNLPPKFIENMALSWFWRFMQEPKRLFSNIFINELLFIFYILPRAMMHRFGYAGKFPHISFLIKIKH